MTKEESTIMNGLAIILMYVHHLFYMSDRVIEYGIISLTPTDTLVKLGQYGNACITLFAFVSGQLDGMASSALMIIGNLSRLILKTISAPIA